MTMRFQQVDVSMTSNHLELSDKFMQVVSGGKYNLHNRARRITNFRVLKWNYYDTTF